MRIIGGLYRSRVLRFPSRPGLRPSPDRVRETLFNWLGQDLGGRDCCDLFAGSGALGFEAVSRGARHVVMVERDAVTYEALRRNAHALRCEAAVELRRADALEFVRDAKQAFDIVLLDPPFQSELLARLAPELSRLTRRGGMAYVESAGGIALASPWQLHRRASAGQVTYQLFIHGNQ
ncbi:MAG: 16S rRNA (guanine(966)-N(2))-methyltransferase RsmD [Burkholderiales bacterium]|nr:16S rRNA (guanine(966)-N(2))-methyltransferase RsmD [Burkholderiales bacterium]